MLQRQLFIDRFYSQPFQSEIMKKAFTLIELLIVLVIIGILTILAIPQCKKYILKAKTAEALNMLGAIRRAELAYRTETGDWLYIQDYTSPDAYKLWDLLGVKTTRLPWGGSSFPGGGKYFFFLSAAKENFGGSTGWFGAWYIDPVNGQPHMPGNFGYTGQEDCIYMNCADGTVSGDGLFTGVH